MEKKETYAINLRNDQNKKTRGDNEMKNKLYLVITFCLVTVLLTSCGLVGSKSNMIQCTGKQTVASASPGETKWVFGTSHTTGEEVVYNQESNCPELNGVFTVNINYTTGTDVLWGTFYYETPYDGGGVIEGTFHATQNVSNGAFNAETTSYRSTGSLEGLKFDGIFTGTANNPTISFEAALQNATEE